MTLWRTYIHSNGKKWPNIFINIYIYQTIHKHKYIYTKISAISILHGFCAKSEIFPLSAVHMTIASPPSFCHISYSNCFSSTLTKHHPEESQKMFAQSKQHVHRWNSTDSPWRLVSQGTVARFGKLTALRTKESHSLKIIQLQRQGILLDGSSKITTINIITLLNSVSVSCYKFLNIHDITWL